MTNLKTITIMTTFKARFTGNPEDLKTFLVCGLKNLSTKIMNGNSLFVSWICENENTTHEEIMDDINMLQAESFNVELKSFFKSC